MGGGPRRQGLPINCQIFTTLIWRLNVSTSFRNHKMTTEKGCNFFGGEGGVRPRNPRRKSWLRVWENALRLTLVWAPELSIRLCSSLSRQRFERYLKSRTNSLKGDAGHTSYPNSVGYSAGPRTRENRSAVDTPLKIGRWWVTVKRVNHL